MHAKDINKFESRPATLSQADLIRDVERDSSLFFQMYAKLMSVDTSGEPVLGDPFEALAAAYSEDSNGLDGSDLPREQLRDLEWQPAVHEDSNAFVLKREIDFGLANVSMPPNIDGSGVTNVVETMIPFPSAPIHGVQRMHMYNRRSTIRFSEAFHTIRVIKPVGASGPPARIYLLHNGLNETEKMGRYYQLAARLCADSTSDEDPTANGYSACIICPFPGHLTREAYKKFASKPLDRYLWDGSHLFRQFLRSMVETRWLLSMIVRRSKYLLPSGTTLLLENEEIEQSRLESEALSHAMYKDYRQMREASCDSLSHASQKNARESDDARSVSPPPYRAHIKRCIEAFRHELGLSEDPETIYDSTAPGVDDQEPSIHVLGYSLGGFMAHSVFMTWPWAVDSCTSLMSEPPRV